MATAYISCAPRAAIIFTYAMLITMAALAATATVALTAAFVPLCPPIYNLKSRALGAWVAPATPREKAGSKIKKLLENKKQTTRLKQNREQIKNIFSKRDVFRLENQKNKLNFKM